MSRTSSKMIPLLAIPDRKKAKELAKTVKEEWGPNQDDWLKGASIDLHVKDISGLQGLLLPYHNQRMKDYLFRVVLSDTLSENDQTFVLAHEIGHTFFYAGTPRTRVLPLKSNALSRPLAVDPEEEWCDWFAGYLTGLRPPPRS